MQRFNPTRLLGTALVLGLASILAVPAPGEVDAAYNGAAGQATCPATQIEAIGCPLGPDATGSAGLDRRRARRQGTRKPGESGEPPSLAEFEQIATRYGDWLRLQLKVRQMSQRQLAQRAGLDNSTISRLIRGKRFPKLQTASRIVAGLNGGFDHGLIVPRDTPATARVEYALRADELLSEDQVGAIMRSYLAMRADRRSRL